VLTQAVAVKETGPKETVAGFGEVYAFSPTFIAVHRDQRTEIDFWNLQPDDEHDLALMGSDLKILMYVKLPPLKKTSFIFTFHQEGLIDFKCMLHQPEMSGPILVLGICPRAGRRARSALKAFFCQDRSLAFDTHQALVRRGLRAFSACPPMLTWLYARTVNLSPSKLPD
jgi:plastocyanin